MTEYTIATDPRGAKTILATFEHHADATDAFETASAKLSDADGGSVIFIADGEHISSVIHRTGMASSWRFGDDPEWKQAEA
jgi:hypothetical protein